MELRYNTYDILEAIRQRPGMYLGDCSTLGLHTFLVGYSLAMHQMGATDTA